MISKRKRIEAARKAVSRDINAHAGMGRYAAGLASEGYNGGYRDALDDVLLLLNGIVPNRGGWWHGDIK